MEIIIGMDGGGTKTHCVAANLEGKILYEVTGEASSFLTLGTEKVSETIFNLIEECLKNLNLDFSDVKIVLLGTTGAGRKVDAERLKITFDNFVKKKNLKINFIVESDARIALEGAFSGKPGSILIAGTGSIIFGKDKHGIIHRAGGFGRFIGDQGSGYSIGRKGLAAVSKDMDGRGEKTLIRKFLEDKFGITNPETLIIEIHKNNFDIASAAPLVIDAAKKNDKAAINILNEESDELLLHVSAMNKILNEPEMNLCFIGSLISSDNLYSKILKEKIREQLQKVKIIQPENPPAIGAILMAKKLV